MTFEGQQLKGADAIVAKLASVGQVTHSVKSVDIQPSNTTAAILIFVTGFVVIGGDSDNALHFSEVFNLVSIGPQAYYVHNGFYRLNYGL